MQPSLWDWANGHMARFRVPSIIEIVDEIKKSPTRNIKKTNLKAEGGKRFDQQKRSKPFIHQSER